ncbi:MAG: HEPN domain-containing protein [Actinomycetes bacterium]
MCQDGADRFLRYSTGTYRCEWRLSGHEPFPSGEITLEAGRSIHGRIDASLNSEIRDYVFAKPQNVGRLSGWTTRDFDVVVRPAYIQNILPDKSSFHGDVALIGPQIDGIPGDLYSEIVFQVTGMDAVFGVAPFQSVDNSVDGVVTARMRPGVINSQEIDGEALHCEYEFLVDTDGRYHLHLTPSPRVRVIGEARTPEAWLTDWVVPLRRLIEVATASPQEVTWVLLRETGNQSSSDKTAQVFHRFIQQAPFVSRAENISGLAGDRPPTFNFSRIEEPLSIVRRWKSLAASKNAFYQLYASAVAQSDLPESARFLYLVQALEALHTAENPHVNDPDVEDDAIKGTEPDDTARSITELINKVQGCTNSTERRKIKKALMRSTAPTLADRLGELMSESQNAQRDADITATLLAPTLLGEDRHPSSIIATTRNDISHGNRAYSSIDLRCVNDHLEPLAGALLVSRLLEPWTRSPASSTG